MNKESRVNIAAPVWKSKNGDVALTDRVNMPDEYLQNILNSAEYRYMKYNNRANSLAKQIESLEEMSVIAYRKSEIFHNLIKGIKREAARRGITILSLAEKDTTKFDILRKGMDVELETEPAEVA
jgi:hypothetical protein